MTTGAINGNGNGNGHMVKWISNVSATVFVALLIWLFATTVRNLTEIELLKSRVYGIEHRKDRE